MRLVGRNSSAVERVRRGELEAGVVGLPIDDDKLDVRPIVRDEVLYVSASPKRTRRPVTIEQLVATPLVFYDAESGDKDPIRRQLAERAQALGVRLQPKVEVELKEIALRLVAAGLGDTYLPSAFTHAPYYPEAFAPRPSAPRSMTRSRSSRAPAGGSRPGCARCSGTSRRTCASSRRRSTGHDEQAPLLARSSSKALASRQRRRGHRGLPGRARRPRDGDRREQRPPDRPVARSSSASILMAFATA